MQHNQLVVLAVLLLLCVRSLALGQVLVKSTDYFKSQTGITKAAILYRRSTDTDLTRVTLLTWENNTLVAHNRAELPDGTCSQLSLWQSDLIASSNTTYSTSNIHGF